MSYFESRLKANFENLDEIKEKIKWSEILGIRNVILEPTNKIDNIPLDLKNKIRELSSVNIYFRINIRTDNLNFFKKRIKSYNNFEDILSIESSNKDVQIHAARDSRVDLISFSDLNILRSLTRGILSLVKQNNSFIEISLAQIFEKNLYLQSKNFRSLYRFLHLVHKSKIKYIISGNFGDIYDYRHPRSLISTCNSLLELPINEAKKAFKESPRELLERCKKN